MSKTEILAVLPNLSAQERGEILVQLWRLQESVGLTEQEKAALDEAQAAYDENPSIGASWSEVEARLPDR